jgi:hypothetical protein
MLLSSHKKPSGPGRLRAALERARETYREYSGAEEEEPAHPAKRKAEVVERAPLPVRPRTEDPDVYLDVPKLEVDEIDLKLDELRARVALQARVLDLVQLDVGVDAELSGVELDIKGVSAEALLKVRLDNLAVIVDRVMRTVESNPGFLQSLTDNLGSTVERLGNGAGAAVEHLSGADSSNSSNSADSSGSSDS